MLEKYFYMGQGGRCGQWASCFNQWNGDEKEYEISIFHGTKEEFFFSMAKI
jgi:hypothetical protein